MKKLLIVSVAGLFLSGCANTSNIDANIQQVQNYTRQICKFVPTIETVAKIFAVGYIADTASSVANAICASVTSVPLADGPGDHLPRVKGVIVKGYFAK